MDLLNQDFTTQEDALYLVEAAWEHYLRDFPNIPKEYPEGFASAVWSLSNSHEPPPECMNLVWSGLEAFTCKRCLGFPTSTEEEGEMR